MSIVDSLYRDHIIVADFNMIVNRNLDCITLQKNNDSLHHYFVN